ncbi:hypothetical protein QQF64_007780 [Cirrhinus molitorella]|uniref:Uncharacterized protein n=1 Tax=Cirrhinus molitorella TaxID=172907 RepID=A0ABR3MC83_9TELE
MSHLFTDEEKKRTEGRLRRKEKRNTLLEQESFFIFFKKKRLQEERGAVPQNQGPSPGDCSSPGPPSSTPTPFLTPPPHPLPHLLPPVPNPSAAKPSGGSSSSSSSSGGKTPGKCNGRAERHSVLIWQQRSQKGRAAALCRQLSADQEQLRLGPESQQWLGQSQDLAWSPKSAKDRTASCRSPLRKSPLRPVTKRTCLFRVSEMKDGDPEKWAGPNGIGQTDASDNLQTTISSSAQSPNAANGSTDAEC